MIEKERRWLTPDELNLFYKITKSTQSKMRMKKRIPYSKVGKFIRYDIKEIDKWLENNKVVGA